MNGRVTQYRNDTTNEWFDQLPPKTDLATWRHGVNGGTPPGSIRAFLSLAAARAAYSKPARPCKSPLLHGIQTNLSTNFVKDTKRWRLVFDVPFVEVSKGSFMMPHHPAASRQPPAASPPPLHPPTHPSAFIGPFGSQLLTSPPQARWNRLSCRVM